LEALAFLSYFGTHNVLFLTLSPRIAGRKVRAARKNLVSFTANPFVCKDRWGKVAQKLCIPSGP